MNNKRFQQLKGMLKKGKDYDKVMGFFVDHFEEVKVLSEPTQDPFIEAAVEAAVVYMTGQSGLGDFLVHTLPESEFFHGGFRSNGHMGAFFYFEDIHMGLACVAYGKNELRVARFKATLLCQN